MKAISKLLLSATLLSTLLTSCSDDSDKSPVAPAGNIIATVDGKAWQATGVAIIANNTISVGGQSGGKTVQAIVFKDDIVGTYELKGIGTLTTFTPEGMVAYQVSGSSDAFASIYFDNTESVGSVTISEIDEVNKTVSGTFHSKVKSFTNGTTTEITTGSFTKVPYTTETTQSTMSVKINGTQFNSDLVVSASAMGTLVLNGQTLGGQQIITISVPDDVAVGTFAFGELGLSDQYTTYTADGKTYTSISGTLKITEHNKTSKHIEGTFNFSAEPFGFEGSNVSATEGEFSVDY